MQNQKKKYSLKTWQINFENNPHKVIVSTDDGGYGEKGFVTDLVEKLVNETQFDGVYTCGPEIMMYKTVNLLILRYFCSS